mmetsp:Transcript_19786/g.45782  ORF Transcript_19786/g.45782 Transcript_19786/m.45782 type:complete len:176 (-) Transcript_19786:305-832(-)
MYDARSCTFHRFKLPGRGVNCAACGDTPSIANMEQSDAFCSEHNLRGVGSCAPCADGGAAADDAAARACSVEEYCAVRQSGNPHVLLDVRAKTQFEMCSLRGAINIPLDQLESRIGEVKDATEQCALPLFVICRRGVASKAATQVLAGGGIGPTFDVKGGLSAWAEAVGDGFPPY